MNVGPSYASKVKLILNGGKSAHSVPKNGASYGVKFKVEATLPNSCVKATVVMAGW